MRIDIAPGIAIESSELEERFVRASGPGGQNVNKVATAVELLFDVAASALPEDVKTRVVALAGKRMSSEGVLMIDSRVYRTQAQNREAARARLVAFLKQAAAKPRTRHKTKVSRASKAKRLDEKKRRSSIKSNRRSGNDD